jgi:hypothetical protein
MSKPEPGLVFGEAFTEHRQPAQPLLESRGLARIPPPLSHSDSSVRPRAGHGKQIDALCVAVAVRT